MAAAIAVLTEHGYAGCSVAAVAARAGVATGTVYKHFASKAELVAEVFQQVVSGEVAAVASAAALPGTLTDRVVAVLETFARRALKVPRLAYALLAEPVDAGAAGELLVGPLSMDDPPVDTVPALITFTLRALGGSSRDAVDA